MITIPAIVHSSSREECFNWLKAVRRDPMSEKVSYRRKLWLCSVNPYPVICQPILSVPKRRRSGQAPAGMASFWPF
jgi:hypothetical protein